MTGDEPAFPSNQFYRNGMTIRTWLAGQVFSGLLAGGMDSESDEPWESDIAAAAVRAADALIDALNKPAPYTF